MNTNTSFTIEDFGDFRSELFVELGKTEYTLVPIESFLRLPTIRHNRDVERRKKRVAKILNKKGMIEHLKVIIAQYPDGEKEIMNGNTRKQIWIEGLSDKPDYVIAQINHYTNKNEAKAEYYAVDSSDSVENASDKFTGAFRALNMDLQSKLKGGAINNAVCDFMSIWPDSNIPKHSKHASDFYIKTTRLLRNEIIKLDSILSEIEQARSGAKESMRQSNFKVVSFAFLKKHGIENGRVVEGIKKLFQGSINWPGNTRRTDGISHINYELRNDISSWLPKGATRSESREQLDFIFSCFKKWMDEEEMSNSRRYQRENSPYLNFFNNVELEEDKILIS